MGPSRQVESHRGQETQVVLDSDARSGPHENIPMHELQACSQAQGSLILSWHQMKRVISQSFQRLGDNFDNCKVLCW